MKKVTEAELLRLEKIYTFEEKYIAKGYEYIAGVDEVGRGPLCGPVVAAAVIMPKNLKLPFVNDSKKISEKMREYLESEIRKNAIAISVFEVSAETIDKINILEATKLAMRNAVLALVVMPNVVLVDAVKIPELGIEQEAIIKGDEKSHSIAAASIIAKVWRDRKMKEMAAVHPAYLWHKNKGYGTKEHVSVIKSNGLTEFHRRTFCKNFAKEKHHEHENF